MVETRRKIDAADVASALDQLAQIDRQIAQVEERRPRGRLPCISVGAGLLAPFVAAITLGVCDALSAAVLGFGADQGATEAAQLATGDQLHAIQTLFLAGEALALTCTLLALGLGIAAVRRARTRADARADAEMARSGVLLGAIELAGWLALGIWLLMTIAPFS